MKLYSITQKRGKDRRKVHLGDQLTTPCGGHDPIYIFFIVIKSHEKTKTNNNWSYEQVLPMLLKSNIVSAAVP